MIEVQNLIDEVMLDTPAYLGFESAYITKDANAVARFRSAISISRDKKLAYYLRCLNDLSTLNLKPEPIEVNFNYNGLYHSLADLRLLSLNHNVDQNVLNRFEEVMDEFTTLGKRLGLKGLVAGNKLLKETSDANLAVAIVGSVLTKWISKSTKKFIDDNTLKQAILKFLSSYFANIFECLSPDSMVLDKTGILSVEQIAKVRDVLRTKFIETSQYIGDSKNYRMEFREKKEVVKLLTKNDNLDLIKNILDTKYVTTTNAMKDVLAYKGMEQTRGYGEDAMKKYIANGTIPNILDLISMMLQHNSIILKYIRVALTDMHKI